MAMIKVRHVALVLIVAVTLAPLLEAAGQTDFLLAPTWVYDFVPLDVPGAVSTVPEGINNHNEIAGSFSDGSGVGRTFVLSNGVFTTLAWEGANTTIARDINDDGSVVGEYQLSGRSNAFRYSAGTFSVPFSSFPEDSVAMGINNQGALVGMVGIRKFDGYHLYGYFDGDYLENIFLSGINEARHAVGTDLRAAVDGVWRGFLASTDVTFLAYKGALQTDPNDLNNLDTVVGSYYSSEQLDGGFVWTNGKFVGIDYPGADETAVKGINDAGIIVGTYRAGIQTRGFVGVPRSPLKVLINGTEGSMTLHRAQPLRVDLAFQAPPSGALEPAELYIGVVAPSGVWWLNSAGAFVAAPTRYFTGPLPAFGPSPLISLPTASALTPGIYTWFMVADDDTNGVPNGAFFDFAELTVH